MNEHPQATFLSQLNWRFATKKFDATRTLTDEQVAHILTAIRFAPTSYGLQPFHVYVVQNNDLRKKMKLQSYLQSQVTDASHLLVFCARTDIDSRVDAYIDLLSNGSTLEALKLAPTKLVMSQSMKKKLANGTARTWAERQVYLALGFALAACAELGIDSCPMEGFSEDTIDTILGVPSHMKSVAYLALGYRRENPAYEKKRFPEDDLFTHVQ